MTRLVVALLLALTPSLAQDPAVIFDEANTFFQRANRLQSNDPEAARGLYQRAILRYERLISESGIHNGKLHYNLGNAYFQMDDIGRAILNYRKAERLNPSDSNVSQTLDFARTRRYDKFEDAQQTQVLRTLLFWHFDLPPSTRLGIFTVLSLVFWGAMILRLLGRFTIPGGALAGLGIVAALFLGSIVYDAAVGEKQRHGVVTAPDVVARMGDGETYEPSFTDPLHAGAEVRLLEQRPDWYQVELPDGRRCWLPSRDVELINQ